MQQVLSQLRESLKRNAIILIGMLVAVVVRFVRNFLKLMC